MNTTRVGCVLTLCATLVYGCDSPPPTVPSLPPPPQAPPQPSFSVRILGVVLDDSEAPVPNVEMQGQGGRTWARTVTDANGRYELAGTVPWSGVEVAIKKPHYDDAVYFVGLEKGAGTIERNFHLYPSLTINAGNSIPVWIRADDPSCGFDLEYLCRQVRVRSLGRGILLLDVTSENPRVGPGLNIGPVPIFYQLSTHASIAVDAGEEVSMYILRWWNDMLGTQRLTLETHLQPQ